MLNNKTVSLSILETEDGRLGNQACGQSPAGLSCRSQERAGLFEGSLTGLYIEGVDGAKSGYSRTLRDTEAK